jgi:hypothetical protein
MSAHLVPLSGPPPHLYWTLYLVKSTNCELDYYAVVPRHAQARYIRNASRNAICEAVQTKP